MVILIPLRQFVARNVSVAMQSGKEREIDAIDCQKGLTSQ